MAFLSSGSVELVPLDPDIDAHVEAYRRSRTDPSMRATGAYCPFRSALVGASDGSFSGLDGW